MRVHLRGIHSVHKRLADGTTATYHYAWRGGPRLTGEPGAIDFMRAYNAAIAARYQPPQGVFFTIIAEYKASSEYKKLRDSTRRDYARYLKLIEAEFGTLPLAAISEPGARGLFKAWRGGMQATPRTADLAWSVLARVLSVALDNERITVNPCKEGGRLYQADRTDKVWTDAMLQAAAASFPEHLRWVLTLAFWTGQRQGDLLRLPWSAYNGLHIRLKQSKGNRRVLVRVSEALRAELDRIPRRGPTILTSTDKVPWTSDGFRASWRRACEAAGIVGVTFHDLRGSAVTRLAEAGCTITEIASITGHSLNDVNAILDAHYLSRSQALSDGAILKLERKESGTDSVN